MHDPNFQTLTINNYNSVNRHLLLISFLHNIPLVLIFGVQ